jgi:hypothetical protein
MSTVKPDWNKPTPPVEKCPECGLPIKPVAVLDVDELALYGWDCDNLHNSVSDSEDWLDDHEWPFEETYAKCVELEALGFIVV